MQVSDTDSFIEEVTEEVRRDQMFAYLRRYGWIAALVVVAIVGGAGVNEYRKSKAIDAAQELGDDIIGALASDDAAGRAQALGQVTASTAGGSAILDLLNASALANSDDIAQAVTRLEAVAANGELPLIYRQIATFKALTLQSDTLSAQDRRLQFEALAQPGAPLNLLAQEQLALIDLEDGNPQAAIDRFQAILQNASVDAALRQRASQMIVALGGTPELPTTLEQG